MPDQGRNIMIGGFVIAAVIVAVWIILFLNPSIGDNGQTIKVRFHDIDKVNVGTRVLFAGKPVGNVYSICMVPAAREQAESCDGPIYIFELTLKIDSHVKVYTSDEFDIRTSGLLGERSVAIIPHKPEPGVPYKLVTSNMIIVSDSTPSLEGMLSSLNKKGFFDNMSLTAKNVQEITHSLNNHKALSEMVANVQAFSDSLKKFTAKLDAKWPKLEMTIEDIAEMAQNFKGMSEKMAKGEGTFGKFLNDDKLFLQMSSMMTKGEVLMNDINHYGFLFHLDKKWQRQRTLRMNQLDELATAQQFRNYFEEEMDRISTSLSRVSILMEKAEGNARGAVATGALMSNNDYTKAFAELLRRVKTVDGKLKEYNAMVNKPGEIINTTPSPTENKDITEPSSTPEGQKKVGCNCEKCRNQTAKK